MARHGKKGEYIMDPILAAALISAGVGVAKNEFIDRPAAERQRKQEGIIAAWSPWTNMAPQRVGDPNALDSALQGGLFGAAVGKQMKEAQGTDITGGTDKNQYSLGLDGGYGKPMASPYTLMTSSPLSSVGYVGGSGLDVAPEFLPPGYTAQEPITYEGLYRQPNSSGMASNIKRTR